VATYEPNKERFALQGELLVWLSKWEKSRLMMMAIALVDEALDRRHRAREVGDFEEADRIRDTLAGLGVEIEDAGDGTRWYLKDENPQGTKRFRDWLASQWGKKAKRAFPPKGDE